MARLNEEFQLTFHEVDSSIQIEFGEDPVTFSIGEIKQIVSIPIVFEEDTNFFPVQIADHQELEVLFGDVIVVNTGGGGGGEGSHKAIQIYTSTGILTALQKQILLENYSNYIVYNNEFYKLKYKNGQTFRYYTQTNLVGTILYIEINMQEGNWQVCTIVDPHPLDNVRHITAEERSFWNNKLNYDTVLDERLILNRN